MVIVFSLCANISWNSTSAETMRQDAETSVSIDFPFAVGGAAVMREQLELQSLSVNKEQF